MRIHLLLVQPLANAEHLGSQLDDWVLPHFGLMTSSAAPFSYSQFRVVLAVLNTILFVD
jgi:hypothetical protein